MRPHRRKVLLHAGGVLVAIGLAGMLVVSSGVVSIAASSGHWPLMGWFLHFAARRSVSTHALGIDTPPLDDAAQVRLGAQHYRLQCQGCHGAPGTAAEPTYQSMTPPPPDLRENAAQWRPRELYWIVQHGLKYTAMPAWPSPARVDEAWALVAFLVQLPGLDPERYRELAGRPPPRGGDALSAALADCAGCHGGAGEGGGRIPRLAGQSAAYLRATLDAYAEDRRHSGFMHSIAAMLEPGLRDRIARHYAELDAAPDTAADTEPHRRGRRLALEGDPDDGVPPCVSCHGAQAAPQHPRLDGQPREYLRLQLQLFRDGRRGGTPYAHLMQTVAHRLDPQQMEDAAAYYGR